MTMDPHMMDPSKTKHFISVVAGVLFFGGIFSAGLGFVIEIFNVWWSSL